ncbi:MAG: hypothetical protein N3G22_02815 [Candidatus Micrarchaeota archaeon]|nr:hypothetical protein [Candidatus Micrarchaeota archaeon]
MPDAIRLLGGSLLFLFFFATLLHPQTAENQTLFNFGTMQEGQKFVASPGSNLTFPIYFFMDEKYGNRITHVKLGVDELPPGWMVEFDPPMHSILVNVSGILVNSTENLYVTPKPVLPAIPENPEPGIYYLKSPSGKGYLQAKRVLVRVQVPKDAVLGKSYKLKLSATAFWFGQIGNVALQQSRAFNYDVIVAQKEYTEKILTPEEAEALLGKKEQKPMDINQVLVYVLGALVVLMGAYILLSRKKK